MNPSTRKIILRGIVFDASPVAQVLARAPYAAIGCVEAHGLACILAVLVWNAQPVRYAHLTAAAAGVLLTSAHLGFAVAQLLAASGPRARAAV